jgi:hypothetical protein
MDSIVTDILHVCYGRLHQLKSFVCPHVNAASYTNICCLDLGSYHWPTLRPVWTSLLAFDRIIVARLWSYDGFYIHTILSSVAFPRSC